MKMIFSYKIFKQNRHVYRKICIPTFLPTLYSPKTQLYSCFSEETVYSWNFHLQIILYSFKNIYMHTSYIYSHIHICKHYTYINALTKIRYQVLFYKLDFLLCNCEFLEYVIQTHLIILIA